MCEVNFNKKSKRITGYKMLAQRIEDGKLFSSFTGEPFELGIVPKAPKKCKRICNWNRDLDEYDFNECSFYIPQYDGYTAAFKKKNDAIMLIAVMDTRSLDYKLVLTKITFEGVTYNGNYNGEIIAGNNIKSIKILN